MTVAFDFLSRSEQDTERLGRALARCLRANDVIALCGDLGAGKTFLTRALATALGVAADDVNSPTFMLLQQYPGAELNVHHCDAYRLADPAEFADFGGADALYAGGVSVIEWADRIADELPAETLWIEIEVLSPEHRRFACAARSPRAVELLESLQQALASDPAV